MDSADVIIIGGGMVGMTLALALDAHGLTSHVIDTADLSSTLLPAFDGRASAIASASARMFGVIGLSEALGDGCAIRAIRVTDGLSPLHLHFDSADSTGGPLGYMFENRQLRAAMLARAAVAAGIQIHAPARASRIDRAEAGVTVTLDTGRTLTAPLIVAADGRRSKLREDSGIRIANWQYDQTAIVTTIAHAEPHDCVAFELFYPTGPFAILPMPDDAAGRHRSAIVWTVEARDAAATLALPPRALAAEIEARMGGFLGTIEMIAPAASYPLGFHHAERYVDQRLALIGDAAHGIHPIAGQGLNMGLRDVAALTEVLVDAVRIGLDPGSATILDRYQSWRRLDNAMVSAATDGLNRLFALPGRPAAVVRRLGLAAVERIAPLKRRFMAEARGETGDRPKLLLGELV